MTSGSIELADMQFPLRHKTDDALSIAWGTCTTSALEFPMGTESQNQRATTSMDVPSPCAQLTDWGKKVSKAPEIEQPLEVSVTLSAASRACARSLHEFQQRRLAKACSAASLCQIPGNESSAARCLGRTMDKLQPWQRATD
eukprot:CAMPEP_0170399698 /NCGR_PEP_ID=MMETSP0117_2-20130122/24102_1 /TAXON_ID=400756 /ORGANISM="Durinskia baltica, Strain CSIRO CS-38" /LENGTH=141 /DNA_ID=CAMNT_0010656395 /DNA_START=34 /DNA_END=457 /DNA_ORIENTATION=+